MKLEVGKKYKNRKGEVVKITNKECGRIWPYLGDDKKLYTPSGFYKEFVESPDDLIEEVEQPTYRLTDLLDKVNEQNAQMEDYIIPEQEDSVKFQTGDRVFDVLRGQVFELEAFSHSCYPFRTSTGLTMTEDGKEYTGDKYPRYLSLEKARARGYDVPKQTVKQIKTVVVVFDPEENETYIARTDQTWYREPGFTWKEVNLEWEKEI